MPFYAAFQHLPTGAIPQAQVTAGGQPVTFAPSGGVPTSAPGGTGNVATGTGLNVVIFPMRWVYPSQFVKLQAAGVRGASKKGGGVMPADRWGYTNEGEYGYSVLFPDRSDLDKASATGAIMFAGKVHGDANWWILNTDFAMLNSAGAPYSITTQGRVFSKVLLHEYEIWKSTYDQIRFHVQQKYKIDPNQYADPNLTLPIDGQTTPATTPAVPAGGSIAQQAAQAAQDATTAQAPVTYYPSDSGETDVPQLAPATPATAPTAASGGGAAAGISAGVLLLLLLRH